jgi:hypothetical protein
MANRRPEQAALRAQGCGYLVMGVEPGSLHGITPIDPSQLDQGVQHYLGPDGPAWSLQYVQEAGATVLVITVERPEPGHRIFTLEREFTRSDGKTYLAGIPFVRRPGRTIQAEPADMRALEQRLVAPAPGLLTWSENTCEVCGLEEPKTSPARHVYQFTGVSVRQLYIITLH